MSRFLTRIFRERGAGGRALSRGRRDGDSDVEHAKGPGAEKLRRQQEDFLLDLLWDPATSGASRTSTRPALLRSWARTVGRKPQEMFKRVRQCSRSPGRSAPLSDNAMGYGNVMLRPVESLDWMMYHVPVVG
jgi:hypothetical protein